MLGTWPEVKNKLYLASCVIQSQQVLLSADVDTHCKKMTKSSLRGGRREVEGGEGEQQVREGGRLGGSKGGGPLGPQPFSAMKKANKWF